MLKTMKSVALCPSGGMRPSRKVGSLRCAFHGVSPLDWPPMKFLTVDEISTSNNPSDD